MHDPVLFMTERGDRSFSVAVPRVWNSVPTTVRDFATLTHLRASGNCSLKAFLFVWWPRRRWRWTGAFKWTY